MADDRTNPYLSPNSTSRTLDNSTHLTAVQKTVMVLACVQFFAALMWFSFLFRHGTSYGLRGGQWWIMELKNVVVVGALFLTYVFVIRAATPIPNRLPLAACALWLLLCSSWLYVFVTQCLTRGTSYVVLGTVSLFVIPIMLSAAVLFLPARSRRICSQPGPSVE